MILKKKKNFLMNHASQTTLPNKKPAEILFLENRKKGRERKQKIKQLHHSNHSSNPLFWTEKSKGLKFCSADKLNKEKK